MKKKWSEGMLSNSNSVLGRYKQLKMLLRLLAIKFLPASKQKKTNAELRRNSKRI